MPKDNSAEIQELKDTVQTLTSTVKELQTKIEDVKNMPIKLDRYLDNESKQIIEDVVNEQLFDAVWDKYTYYSSMFESSDRYLTPGTGAFQGVGQGGLLLETTAVTNNEALISLLVGTSDKVMNFEKEARFRFLAYVAETTSNVFYVSTLLEDTTVYAGFKITNGSVIGIVKDGTTESVTPTIATVSGNEVVEYELRYYPKGKVVFFINKIEKATLTTNLPKERGIGGDKYIFQASLKTTNAASKSAVISFWEFIQKK